MGCGIGCLARTGARVRSFVMKWTLPTPSVVSRFAPTLEAIARAALDVVLPPRCLSCAESVDRQGTLCTRCWSGLTFLAPPWCACCGEPFEGVVGTDPSDDTICARCAGSSPPYARARSALSYDDGSRGMIVGFKHADQTYAASAFGGWLVRAGADMLTPGVIVAPVPLHRWKLFSRRYNQAALLAKDVGRRAGLPVLQGLLVRHRRTTPQGAYGRAGRQRNIRGAFHVRPALVERVRGRPVVLIDDVLTTGATVAECARVLLRAGAGRVDVLTVARVIRAGAP
jgi:ComF family protein